MLGGGGGSISGTWPRNDGEEGEFVFAADETWAYTIAGAERARGTYTWEPASDDEKEEGIKGHIYGTTTEYEGAAVSWDWEAEYTKDNVFWVKSEGQRFPEWGSAYEK